MLPKEEANSRAKIQTLGAWYPWIEKEEKLLCFHTSGTYWKSNLFTWGGIYLKVQHCKTRWTLGGEMGMLEKVTKKKRLLVDPQAGWRQSEAPSLLQCP